MYIKKTGLNDAYSLKTPEDSIKLYKDWAITYDNEFAITANYLSPKKIAEFYAKNSKILDEPILDVGAGTGLVGEYLYKMNRKKIIGIDISAEMLKQANLKRCYSNLIEADISKKIPIEDNSIGAIVSAGTFTHGHVGPEALDELIRVTKPDGLFVISIHSDFFIKKNFKKKFLKLKNQITDPIFENFKIFGKNKDNNFKNGDAFAAIFRKIR